MLHRLHTPTRTGRGADNNSTEGVRILGAEQGRSRLVRLFVVTCRL